MLLSPGGCLELVDVDPDPAGFAALLDAAGEHDVTPRATWEARGGSVLTIWTALSAPRSRRNELAQRVVDELLPVLPGGARDRIREALAAAPLAGPALLTGYSPGTPWSPGATVDIPAVALEQVRAICDGRGVRRKAAAAAEAPTVLLSCVTPDTKDLAATA